MSGYSDRRYTRVRVERLYESASYTAAETSQLPGNGVFYSALFCYCLFTQYVDTIIVI